METPIKEKNGKNIKANNSVFKRKEEINSDKRNRMKASRQLFRQDSTSCNVDNATLLPSDNDIQSSILSASVESSVREPMLHSSTADRTSPLSDAIPHDLMSNDSTSPIAGTSRNITPLRSTVNHDTASSNFTSPMEGTSHNITLPILHTSNDSAPFYNSDLSSSESLSPTATSSRRRQRTRDHPFLQQTPARKRRLPASNQVEMAYSPTPVVDFFDAHSFNDNNFERDPFAAQHVFATNSGLHIFDKISQLFSNSNVIDTEDPNVEECIDQLIKDVNDNLSVEDLGTMNADFNKTFDLKAPLFGCASCGVREFQMGLDKTKRFRDRHLLELGKYKKTQEQLAALNKINRRFRPIFSWYKGCDSSIYNFHPECVDSRLDENGELIELVKLCPVCSNCADKADQPFPRYSIANGIDYGVSSRLPWLKPLSLTEQHSISLTRPYGCIVKLSGYSSECQSAKKGHFIFFRQAQAPQQMADATATRARLSRTTLPDVSDIEKYIGITFIGADEAWKSLIPNRFRNIDDLKIRPQCVYDWLEVLQAVNPHYANVVIDRSLETRQEMNGVIEKFILNAEILSAQLEINIDKFATERPANQPVVEDDALEEPVSTSDHPSVEAQPLEMHASFLTERDPHQSNNENQAAINVLRGLKESITKNVPVHVQQQTEEDEDRLVFINEENLSLRTIDDPLFENTILSSVAQLNVEDEQPVMEESYADQDPDFVPIDFEAGDEWNLPTPDALNLMPQEDDNPPEEENQPPPNVRISAAKDPSNEYESNDYILYTAFPCLFPLGSGLRKSGPLTKTDTRHIFTQFSGIFGKTHRFIFSLFDQMQRHHTAGNIASAVRNRPQSLEAFKDWVNDPTFIPALERATKNPNSKEAKKILGKIMPHVKTFTSAVPFSAAQRKKAMRFLYAMVGHMGMPSFLFTFAPDDTYGSLNIRLSMPQKDNCQFPANDDGLIDALQGDKSVFQNINIERPHLKSLVAADPVATAEIYRIMMHAVYKVCLGMEPEDKSRRSQPLSNKKRGMIGKIHGAFGVNESQARGSLHMHLLIWGGIPPSLLQYGGSVEAVRKYCCIKCIIYICFCIVKILI